MNFTVTDKDGNVIVDFDAAEGNAIVQNGYEVTVNGQKLEKE